jgi:hypothetical protein
LRKRTYLLSVGQMHFLIALPVLVLLVPDWEQDTITCPISRRARAARVLGAKASYGVAIAEAAKARRVKTVLEIMLSDESAAEVRMVAGLVS